MRSRLASFADEGIVPGRVFEALGLNAPFFLISPSGANVAEMIVSTKVGAVFSGTETEEILQFLAKRIRGHIQFEEKKQCRVFILFSVKTSYPIRILWVVTMI
jgi:hypothetical protein